jgi:O-antigen ligase
MDTAKPPPAGQQRLTSARSSRSEAYRVAINGFQDHPLAGDGAAAYEMRWMRERKVAEYFRNAHSLELETASELGLVGLLLLAGILLPLSGGMRGIRRAQGGLTRSQAASAGGVVLVWMVHSALDWDWQMGAVTLPALACGAALVAPRRTASASGGPRSRRR